MEINSVVLPNFSEIFAASMWVWLLPLSLIVIDVITGTLVGMATHSLKSSIASAGMRKKAGELLGLFTVAVVTWAFGLPKSFVSFFSVYFSIVETISIVENLNALGVPIPGFVYKFLAEAKDDLEEPESK